MSGRDDVLWTDHSPHSPSPCTTCGEKVDKLGGKLSLGRIGGGGAVFSFVFLWIILCY